jgi:hypothetical protein
MGCATGAGGVGGRHEDVLGIVGWRCPDVPLVLIGSERASPSRLVATVWVPTEGAVLAWIFSSASVVSSFGGSRHHGSTSPVE